MTILTVLTIYGNREGDFMSFEQIVTYIIAPIVAAIIGGIGLVKVVIPRIIEARLEGEKDTREYTQKKEQLEQLSRLSDNAASQQVVTELLVASQEKEEKANEFIRTTVFNGLDKIKTDTNHIPLLLGEIKEFNKRITGLETRQRLLSNLITGGGVIDADEPADDFEAWKRRKLDDDEANQLSNPTSDQAGNNGE
jgi:hypothetical protein